MSSMPSDHPKVPSPKIGVLLINLGTPDALDYWSMRRYLGEFLSDHRVVEIPRLVWMLILHGVILRIRPAKSALKYASIWTAEGSPLKVWTERQAQALDAIEEAPPGSQLLLWG
ncbi:MAG: ferrochelatase, partial [Gammaproteobacteria bacterium]|nr:ferrochelatase [Gammaproteobacteria bacterium]